jgi:hypothetical protein
MLEVVCTGSIALEIPKHPSLPYANTVPRSAHCIGDPLARQTGDDGN